MIKKYELSDKWIKLLLYIVTALFTVYHGMKLNVPIVLDEIGTLANTAFMVGWNWTDTVESMGGFYYKYGQSVLYAPFFLIFKDPYLLYKAIMVFQSLVLSTIPVFAYIIGRRHLKIEDKRMAALFALVGGGMPSLWLYTYYVRAEMLIIYLPWVIMYCILEAYRAEERKEKKKHVLYSVLVGFFAVLGYMAHSRGLVFIIAVFMTLALVHIFLKKKVVRWWYYLGSTGIWLILDKIIAGYFKANVYGEAGTRHASMESFDFRYMLKVFSKAGFLTQVKLCLGWLYNAFCSTYGLVAVAIVAGVLLLMAALKKKHQITVEETLFTLFSLLNFIGAFLLGVIFFFKPAHQYYIGKAVQRADRLVYGRYMVNAIGLLCLLAIYILVYKKDVLRIRGKLVAVGMYAVVFVLFNTKAAHYLNIGTLNSRYFFSLCVFLKVEPYGATTALFPEVSEALFKAGLLGFAIFAVIILCSLSRKKAVHFFLCIMIILSSITIFKIEFSKIRISRDTVVKNKIHSVAGFIREMDGLYEEFPYILKTLSALEIKLYQLPLAKYRLAEPKILARHGLDDFLIISKKGDYPIEFYEDDFYLFEDYDYEKERDSIIVKGTRLKEKLEEMGYAMKELALE